MRRKIFGENENSNSSNKFLGFLSFVALIVASILIFFNSLLPLFDLNEKWTNILSTIRDLLIVLIIGLNAWAFVKNKGKGIKITFLVCIIIFIVSIIFIWIF